MALSLPRASAVAPLLVQAQHALSLSQEKLGKLLHVSRRTIWRYQSAKSVPVAADLHLLARMVHPHDTALAASLSEAGGATLESLGIVAPEPAPGPQPAMDARTTRFFVDAVVCAAAEELDASPRTMRRALHAAFARARETGLALDVVENALRPGKGDSAKPERRATAKS